MKQQKNTNEITINHHPVNYYAYCFAAIIIWAVLCLAVLMISKNSVMQIAMIVLIVIGMTAIVYTFSKIEKRTITVEYNSYTITIYSARKETIIALSVITCAKYQIYEEFNGYRDIVKKSELTLTVGKKDYFLNDRIEEKQIKSIKSGSNKTVPLMRLYGFIAAHCSDVAVGYQE